MKKRRQASAPPAPMTLSPFVVAGLVLVLLALLVGSFFITQVRHVQQLNYTPRHRQNSVQRVLAAQIADGEVATKTTLTIGNPVLGDPNAPVTIVGFIDYECPFCRKFFLETLPQLKQQYIQSGQVKIVYKSVPIEFHEPSSTLEARAALCARQQGGDATFVAFQDQIYKQTRSNGNGLNRDELELAAADLGLEQLRFVLCMDDPAIQAEIDRDVAAADALQVIGTPSFLVGKSSPDGQVSGTLVFGAQTFPEFQSLINPLLNSK